MKWKSPALVPVLICAGVALLISGFEVLSHFEPRFTLFSRVEWMTYDWRVRLAARQSPPAATNLGFVAITDDSIKALLNGTLPYKFGLYWPRQVHGRLVDELRQQGAKAVGFDVVFAERRPDHKPIIVSNAVIDSDIFFAQQLRSAGNVILPAEHGLPPHSLFRTNASGIADISARREVDGTLRRARPFTDVLIWDPLIQQFAFLYGCDLANARITTDQILLPDAEGGPQVIPILANNDFDRIAVGRQMVERNTGTKPPPQPPVLVQAFTHIRLWQMGIVLAARELQLDLDHAAVDMRGREISLAGTNEVRRVIPLDHDGFIYIDWSLTPTSPVLTRESIESLLDQYEARRDGRSEDVTNRWKDKLVVIGVTATGNDLTDIGATPLEADTSLLSQHWNVANSVLMNRFIRPLPLPWTLMLIAGFASLAGLCTWNFHTLNAVATVFALAIIYATVACWVFNAQRLLLPMVLPIAGSLLITHFSMIAYRVRVEQRERQRTKEIFGRVVSPAVVRELLGQEKLSLSGERRRLTVFFADIRGFTDMTDAAQKRATAYITENKLSSEEAEKQFDLEAATVLKTVNPYLGCIAEVTIKHDGTLDKYIGDCVMAFWGAPVENPHHARDCVRAVIDAQRAVLVLNRVREAENQHRMEENFRRAAAGEAPLPMLDLLTLGSGINTGFMTVGTVGSEQHIMNYTVFGREVNLASRLEGASGRARILIGEETYRDLMRDDPVLAAGCRP
ncbi:MAG TPA: adenylate/guanylate cyclase domain-containing protein, partial [Candidatus Acidoferrum sp.]|nr:adenylate/guanylate cyclase domain-containing protein [Candidatus Acidoferrum sp.]